MLQTYTKLDPTLAEGTVVCNTHFISQSSPDIQKKLKKVEEDPQTPQRDLLNLAFKFSIMGRTGKAREGPTRSGQMPSFSHCPTWLQASINQQRKEATRALLQMQQRRSLGPLMPKGKAFSRSNSQLWHKGTLESRLPKSPSRDLDIPSWSRAGVLRPSSAQPPQTRH